MNKENNFKCTIIKFKDLTKNSHIKAAKETSHEILHYYELYLEIDKDKKTIDDIVNYTLKNKKINVNSATNRQTYRNRIKRCYEIYNKYDKKLDSLYFNITYMSKIYGDENWKEWLKYLDNKINDIKDIETVSSKRDDVKYNENINSKDKSTKSNETNKKLSTYIISNKKEFIFKENYNIIKV